MRYNPLMSTAKRLLRAALAGLAGGLGLAAVVLALTAVQRLRPECGGLTDAECEFERTVGADAAKLEAISALGCALVCAGLLLGLLRRRSSPPRG